MRLLLCLSLLLFLISCNLVGGERVRGNGNVVRQNISVGAFRDLQMRGSMTIRLRQSDAGAVEVETDANIIPYLDIHVEGNTLVVDSKKRVNLSPSRDIVVYITAPEYGSVTLSGSGDLVGENRLSGKELDLRLSGSSEVQMEVDVDKLNVRGSGSGSFRLSGEAETFTCSISGSGDVQAGGLVAQKAKIDVSGSGNADVRAERELDVETSGSADVTYSGNPQVRTHTSGSGSVRKK